MSPLDQLIASTQANLDRMRAQAATQPADLVNAELAKYIAPAPTPAPVLAPAPAAPAPAPVPVQANPQAEIQIFKSLLSQLGLVFRKALTADDMAYMEKHLVEGAPGIIPFLSSESIVAVAQIVHDEYRQFLAGKTK